MKPILAEGGYGFLIFVIIMIITGISKLVRKAKEDAERTAPRSPIRRPGPDPGGKAISLKDFLNDLEGEPTPPPAQPTVQHRPVPPPPPRPMAPPRPGMPQRPPVPPRPVVDPRPVTPGAQARTAPKVQAHAPAARKIDVSSANEGKFEEKFEFHSSFEEEEKKAAVSRKERKPVKKKGIHVGAYQLRARGHGNEIWLTPASARQAIVMSEILRPPLARRRERRG
jgi:hypothetical protein